MLTTHTEIQPIQTRRKMYDVMFFDFSFSSFIYYFCLFRFIHLYLVYWSLHFFYSFHFLTSSTVVGIIEFMFIVSINFCFFSRLLSFNRNNRANLNCSFQWFRIKSLFTLPLVLLFLLFGNFIQSQAVLWV